MRIAVVGGGLVGAATAYHLAKRGVNVILADAHQRGWATGAGAGIISGATASHSHDAYVELALQAERYYPEFVNQLGGGDATGYGACPLLEVAVDNDEVETLLTLARQLLERSGTRSETVERISASEARALCPGLAHVQHALIHRGAARVDGRVLHARLVNVCHSLGVEILNERVESIQAPRRQVQSITAAGTAIPVDGVVVCAGAWTGQLLRPLGLNIPVSPQRGQIVHMRPIDGDVKDWPAVSAMRGHYLLPFGDGRVVAGATRETGSGFNPVWTIDGQAEVLSEALRVCPGLEGSSIVEWRVGLRPLPPDNLPILGPLSGWDGLGLATGHGASGLLLGPYSAKLVVDAMLEPEAARVLVPFSPDRFTR